MNHHTRRHKLATRNDTRDIILYALFLLAVVTATLLINNWVTERVML
jgi:hypothetical protein